MKQQLAELDQNSR